MRVFLIRLQEEPGACKIPRRTDGTSKEKTNKERREMPVDGGDEGGEMLFLGGEEVVKEEERI